MRIAAPTNMSPFYAREALCIIFRLSVAGAVVIEFIRILVILNSQGGNSITRKDGNRV